jgi:biotin carboxyl carrier protein
VTVVRIAPGTYRVEIDGRTEIVYVAGAPGHQSAFWSGHVFIGPFGESAVDSSRPAGPTRHAREQPLSAPMPATVLKVLVQPGATVAKGEVVVILEAMKMALPLRSPDDATVKAVHCREGDLVQPDTVLVQLDTDV